MSLLKPAAPAHAPALKRLAATLRAGDEHDRAVELNLQEEDRVPDSRRRAFHAALAGSKRRAWKDRLKEAVPAAQRSLLVPTPRPGGVAGTWWHHVGLASLQKYKYVSLALHKGSRPPPRLRLARPMGRPENGADLPFWITSATSASAEDIRDRLGLCFIFRGEKLYRISIVVSASSLRMLYIPTAVDAGFYPAWRRPEVSHTEPWGMTRHLQTDLASERELLALPDSADAQEAHLVGVIGSDPPRGYLRERGIV